MARPDRLKALALASLLTLPLGAVACSDGASPTEPASPALEASSADAVASVSDEARGSGRGGGDNADRRGRRGRRGGDDDDARDDRGRRGRRGGRNDRNDDRPRAPRAGQEFEGLVAAVGGGSITLAGGTRILVDGNTQWDPLGDLFSLSEIAGSLNAGDRPRVEGRGQRQADGSFLARTIKAEDER